MTLRNIGALVGAGGGDTEAASCQDGQRPDLAGHDCIAAAQDAVPSHLQTDRVRALGRHPDQR